MKGTIIYYGGFALPDKSASANRVVSNGKLFEAIGYKTVFLGACYDDKFPGIRNISDNMFEESHPATTSEWVKQILSFDKLKELAEKQDNLKMLLLYNVPFITLVLAKKYFSEKGIIVAYDCTEWSQFTEGSFLKKVFKYVDELFIRKFAHKVADKMIVISKMMENAYSSVEKVLRLPPLVDVEDEIWHQSAEKNEDRFTFCFAGFPGGNKDSLDKVVEAFENLKCNNAILKIVGLTEQDFFELYPQINEINNKSIKFLGSKTHKESIKNILDCDCYIFIRQSDRRNNAGFPTKFAESFTCGVPIITTDVSDIKDYIKLTEGSILIEGSETEGIEKAMLSVLEQIKGKNTPELNTSFYYKEYITATKKWLE